MIISQTHRCIFVHVPKTAGTTITSLFEPTLHWNDLVLGGTEFGEAIQPAYRERFGLSKHMRARDIRRVVGQTTWDGFFSFAFVRHPYDRLVSLYAWLHGAVERAAPGAAVWTWPHTQAFLRTRRFSAFIRDPEFLDSLAGRPQAEWVCDDAGRTIVDFVGRYEDLTAGIHVVAERTGLPVASVPVLNPSRRERRADDLPESESDYAFLHATYRRDFELFSYDPTLRL